MFCIYWKAACSIRVPTEIIKQRMQTGVHDSAIGAVRHIVQSEGILGFYSGFKITIFREIPFAFIQFPIYEQLKVFNSRRCIIIISLAVYTIKLPLSMIGIL